ncbi:hypothetical protein BD324DRAFT_649140 [Kockovaella imperatae]|uniref:RRM domain-containing protein n=1 Tax=Kockovaella imperatae TaxID=4999 RepID=A0A1Y1UNF5_9TREE|nr:hypothetical protein BD324DRAFT_649140 [Kockovaella imperatae]ORX39047.1 hypothetical protein BD324DRAFT_649140 [Kockovaella imperatae]
MPNHPEEGQFEADPRVHIDKLSGRYQYEDDETGQEFEWSEPAKAWVPVIDEDQWKQQQAAYSVAGVDESTPANAVLAREERIASKRKKDPAAPKVNARASSSKTQAPAQPSAPKNTAVWVTNLPPDTTPEKLASVFSKAGVLMIGDDGEPRIKMYHDDDGRFRGEALVMYFKEGSVSLAITLLDDTELELGAGHGTMKVREAQYGSGAQDTTSSGAGASGSNGQNKAESSSTLAQNGTENGEAKKKKRGPTAEEKQRMTKRIRRMQDKLTWHSDSDSDDAGAPAEGAPKPGANRMNRVVVLKGMFVPADLEKNPALLLELKEDVRDEAETLGTVTAVTLYDKEEDGVMTIKFAEAVSAEACVLKMNGRFFDGRKIYAGIYGGRERYRKSGVGDLDEDSDKEAERLDKFAQWLVDGDEDDDI